jgi:hypothetical protein
VRAQDRPEGAGRGHAQSFETPIAYLAHPTGKCSAAQTRTGATDGRLTFRVDRARANPAPSVRSSRPLSKVTDQGDNMLWRLAPPDSAARFDLRVETKPVIGADERAKPSFVIYDHVENCVGNSNQHLGLVGRRKALRRLRSHMILAQVRHPEFTVCYKLHMPPGPFRPLKVVEHHDQGDGGHGAHVAGGSGTNFVGRQRPVSLIHLPEPVHPYLGDERAFLEGLRRHLAEPSIEGRQVGHSSSVYADPAPSQRDRLMRYPGEIIGGVGLLDRWDRSNQRTVDAVQRPTGVDGPALVLQAVSRTFNPSFDYRLRVVIDGASVADVSWGWTVHQLAFGPHVIRLWHRSGLIWRASRADATFDLTEQSRVLHCLYRPRMPGLCRRRLNTDRLSTGRFHHLSQHPC